LHLILAAFAWLAAAVIGARAAEISIVGTWEVIEASPAPWSVAEDRPALTADGKRMLKLIITFAPGSIASRSKLFTCRRVVYEPTQLEHDALFDGNLPEPNPAAAAQRLGFAKGDVAGVDVKCINESFTMHFRDRNTALFAHNNVIYTLKRH
ncbi:unnamed protein product, partial [Phaeothamnion confervicola]